MFDLATFLGLLIGVGAILVGNLIEGGTTGHLIQFAAAIIVFGGTFGATLLGSSIQDMKNALRVFFMIFRSRPDAAPEVINEVLKILAMARKIGLVALEPEVKKINHPFLRKGLYLVIDGMAPAMIKDVLSQEIITYEETYKKAAKIFESAGGYAPTIGILGAVLGLIQVMRDVTDPSKIGGGIAVAFVATIYGVGSSNLFFIPTAKKIMSRVREEVFIMELILEGIMGIESGINPYFMRARLNAFLSEHQKRGNN
ncbi:MAG: flagellar motor protein [Dissulfurispiraceae bacterium]|jgi:chemotaxis protein MotA|nr:flagellar motor protein [Dissulfurispiraceae bacterium]